MCEQKFDQINAIILMGVSGCGKTTVGRMLAERLGWEFIESDAYHSSEDVRKMSSGIPLTDEDRQPWLERLHQVLDEHVRMSQRLVMACSALKESYRSELRGELPGIEFVYLKGSYALIRERMAARKAHYMKAGMLQSQFDALEEPRGTLTIDIAQEPEKIAKLILNSLGKN